MEKKKLFFYWLEL